MKQITIALLLFASIVLAMSSRSTSAQTTIEITGPPGSGATFPSRPLVLPNGNFVIHDRLYDADPGNQNDDVGAVHLYSGNGALISTLTGSNPGDMVGHVVKVLANGNFVVSSSFWQNGGVQTGAATWCSGVTGCSGQVSPANSLIGMQGLNQGSMDVVPLSNGDYFVRNIGFDNGSVRGAVTYCAGTGGTVGVPTTANSLFGLSGLGIGAWAIEFDELNRQLIIGRAAESMVTIFRPAAAGPFSAISGRVLSPTGSGVNRATVQLSDTLGNVHTVLTGNTGSFSFTGLENGRSIVISVSSNKQNYAARVLTVAGNITNLNFTPAP
jgi:hypothetical protein